MGRCTPAPCLSVRRPLDDIPVSESVLGKTCLFQRRRQYPRLCTGNYHPPASSPRVAVPSAHSWRPGQRTTPSSQPRPECPGAHSAVVVDLHQGSIGSSRLAAGDVGAGFGRWRIPTVSEPQRLSVCNRPPAPPAVRPPAIGRNECAGTAAVQ